MNTTYYLPFVVYNHLFPQVYTFDLIQKTYFLSKEIELIILKIAPSAVLIIHAELRNLLWLYVLNYKMLQKRKQLKEIYL